MALNPNSVGSAMQPIRVVAQPDFRGVGETVLYTFSGRPDGAYPVSLVAAADGTLFGTTAEGGGRCSGGTAFSLTPIKGGYVERTIFTFPCGAGGAAPNTQLVLSKGALYGTTYSDGDPICRCGIVFELTPHGARYKETVLHAFHHPDGASPWGRVLVDSGGSVFGTTSEGGTSENGVVYKITPSTFGYEETVLYSFAGGTDGSGPTAGLVEDANGAFYGTTDEGGDTACALGCGTVFVLHPGQGVYNADILYRFKGYRDGEYPASELFLGKKGRLYGTTPYGGDAKCPSLEGPGCGTVFELKPGSNGYKKKTLYRFVGSPTDSSVPNGDLIVDRSGAFYGAAGGGAFGRGTVYRLAPNGARFDENVLYSFSGPEDGWGPIGGLVASRQALFGVTLNGGPMGLGNVYRIR